ncbi:MAG: hypothetical protein IJW51_04245 [Clostridia bacterium]|nr:hypothetical protein [Clostridia bacterium]
MGENKSKSHGFLSFVRTKGRLWILIGGGLLGVLLLLLGGMGETSTKEESTDALAARVAEVEAYELHLEKQIKALCEAVQGVGDVDVMITLEGGYTVSYTEDGDGKPVLVGSGSSEEALFERISAPVVGGVGIVCRGGNSAAVRQTLTELVATTLGISANRVFVTGKS